MTKPAAPRPTFAEVSLANDLRKLEEDYLLLEHRARRPSAIHIRSDLERVALITQFRFQCATARAKLLDESLSFEIVLVIARMLEAAFHVARRALNGLDEPIPYTLAPEHQPIGFELVDEPTC